jgi:hypothetical protein
MEEPPNTVPVMKSLCRLLSLGLILCVILVYIFGGKFFQDTPKKQVIELDIFQKTLIQTIQRRYNGSYLCHRRRPRSR